MDYDNSGYVPSWDEPAKGVGCKGGINRMQVLQREMFR